MNSFIEEHNKKVSPVPSELVIHGISIHNRYPDFQIYTLQELTIRSAKATSSQKKSIYSRKKEQ